MNTPIPADLSDLTSTLTTTVPLPVSQPLVDLGPVSQQKYMIDLIEYQRQRVTLEYITKRYDKTEAVVKDNIRRYYGGLNDDMRGLKIKVESSINMLELVLSKPDFMVFGCSLVKDQLGEVLQTIEGFANPI